MSEAELIYYKQNQPIAYKDLYLRLVICILATHIILVYGETKSTFEILLTPIYYYSFFGSFIIAIILFSAVRAIVIRLDKNFDWMEQPVFRIGLQFFFGLIIPGVLAFLLAALYFTVRGHNILRSSYLRYDFQFIILQILIVNCYYIAYYFYGRWLQARDVISSMAKSLSKNDVPIKETFQVSKGANNLFLDIDEIAYCYREGDSNFLRTVSGEDFFITESLDEIQQQLPEERFFRINRQMIANRKNCKGYQLLSYGKLQAEVIPPYKADIVISQKRAVAFKNWLDKRQ